jgi:hypothetical protein
MGAWVIFLVDAGNLVKAADDNPLVVINQITPVDVKFSITEKQLVLLQKQGLYCSQTGFQGIAQIDPSSLDFTLASCFAPEGCEAGSAA